MSYNMADSRAVSATSPDSHKQSVRPCSTASNNSEDESPFLAAGTTPSLPEPREHSPLMPQQVYQDKTSAAGQGDYWLQVDDHSQLGTPIRDSRTATVTTVDAATISTAARYQEDAQRTAWQYEEKRREAHARWTYRVTGAAVCTVVIMVVILMVILL